MTESELKMTPEEKTLLLAVSEGVAKLLEERFTGRFKEHNAAEELKPFRALIDAVKDQTNVDNG